jgi:hypothetical protein
MAEVTLAPITAANHRLSPSGPVIDGAGIPLRMAVSAVWSTGGASNILTNVPREVASTIDTAPFDLRVIVQDVREARRYRVQAKVPIQWTGTGALVSDTIGLRLHATTAAGASLDLNEALDIRATPTLPGATTPYQAPFLLEIDQIVQFDAANMGVNWEDGATVTFALFVDCQIGDAYLGAVENNGLGQSSLAVTEIG